MRRVFCAFLTVWTLSLVLAPASWAQSLVAAVLPSSRSVQVGVPATAFATIINTGSGTATGCTLSPITSVSATFQYQTTDPATNKVTRTPNTPVDIPVGAAQSFVFAFTPVAPFAATDVQLSFKCANGDAASVVSGLNTLLLSGSATPVPDIVVLAATLKNDGIVHIPGTTGTGVFAVATVNVGASGLITATPSTRGASLPITLSICQTDPQTGVCLAPPAPSVTTQIDANTTPTFGVFVAGTGDVLFLPGLFRIFVDFTGSPKPHGSGSVALETEPQPVQLPGFVSPTTKTKVGRNPVDLVLPVGISLTCGISCPPKGGIVPWDFASLEEHPVFNPANPFDATSTLITSVGPGVGQGGEALFFTETLFSENSGGLISVHVASTDFRPVNISVSANLIDLEVSGTCCLRRIKVFLTFTATFCGSATIEPGAPNGAIVCAP